MSYLDNYNIISLLDKLSTLNSVSINLIQNDMLRAKYLILDLLVEPYQNVDLDGYSDEIVRTVKNWKVLKEEKYPKDVIRECSGKKLLKHMIRIDILLRKQIVKSKDPQTIDGSSCDLNNPNLDLTEFCNESSTKLDCSLEEKMLNYCAFLRSGYSVARHNKKISHERFCKLCETIGSEECIPHTEKICTNKPGDDSCGLTNLLSSMSKNGSDALTIKNIGENNMYITGGQTYSDSYPIFAQYIDWSGVEISTRGYDDTDISMQQQWYAATLPDNRLGSSIKYELELYILVNCKFFMHALAFDIAKKKFTLKPRYDYEKTGTDIHSQAYLLEESIPFVEITPSYLDIDGRIPGEDSIDVYEELYLLRVKRKDVEGVDEVFSYIGFSPDSSKTLRFYKKPSMRCCWRISTDKSGTLPKISRWDPENSAHTAPILLYSRKSVIGNNYEGRDSYHLRSTALTYSSHNNKYEYLKFVSMNTNGSTAYRLGGGETYINNKHMNGWNMNRLSTTGVTYGEKPVGTMNIFHSYIYRKTPNDDSVSFMKVENRSHGSYVWADKYNKESNHSKAMNNTLNIIVIKPDNTFLYCRGSSSGVFYSISSIAYLQRNSIDNKFSWIQLSKENQTIPTNVASFWLTDNTSAEMIA